MHQLLLWNKTDYADTLADFVGKENIITSTVELAEILVNWRKYSSLIVLCELNWSYNDTTVKMQRFCGIELVKELRRTHNVNLPILFVSFYSLPDLFHAESEILTAIGHSFCQLPVYPKAFIDKLANEEKLTPVELKDIQLFSCNPKGIVNVKIHQIQGIVNKLNSQNTKEIKAELEKCIGEIHSVFKVNADPILNKFKIEFKEIDADNVNKALRFIEDVGKELIETYSTAPEDAKKTSIIKKAWKLLLLDDELNADSKIVKLLNDKGVDVICTSNAISAKKALSEDNSLRGKISLILSDYRLNEKKDGILFQQRKQGYTFLQEVGEEFRNRLFSAIVYSGMPRQFLLETFKTYKIRPEIYSKKDFKLDDPGARNFLVNRIIELGDANYDAILALPLSSDGWKDNLHETYLLFRNQPDFERRERDICDFCKDWIEKFRTGQNPLTPMIKGDAFIVKKNEPEIKTIERFEAYYKTRRLAQYLHLYFESRSSEDPLDIIPTLLSPKGKKMDKASAKRGFFSQIIGFKREEFPFGATIEELCWFEYDMGINVLDSYKRFREKLNGCEDIIGEFIEETIILKEVLKKTNFRYKNNREHELIFDAKTFKPFLFDKMDLGICIEWLDLQKTNFTKNEHGLKGYLLLLASIEQLYGIELTGNFEPQM